MRAAGRRGSVAIVGGGPGGLMAAILLAQQNYQVEVIEKRPVPVKGGSASDHRTVVFSINARGRLALKQGKIRLPGDAGIDTKDMVMHPAAAAHRVFVDAGGKVNHANFNAMPAGTLFVERAALVEHMYFEAQRLEPERIQYQHEAEVQSVDLQTGTVRTSQGQSIRADTYDLIIGADGRNSVVRSAMQADDPDMTVDIQGRPQVYASFAGLQPQEGFAMADERGTHVSFNFSPHRKHNITFWRGRHNTVSGLSYMLLDRYHELQQTHGFAHMIEEGFPHIPKSWVPQIADTLQNSKPGSQGATVRCSKIAGPKSVLLGDAAHGVTPALGQGVNSALESAMILSQVLEACNHNMAAAIKEFERQRLPDAHALADMDLKSDWRAGTNGKPWYTLDYVGFKFHILANFLLHKLAPTLFQGPVFMRMWAEPMPFRQASFAMQRDTAIAGVALATIFVFASLKLTPVAAASAASLGSLLMSWLRPALH